MNALKWRGDKVTYSTHYKRLVSELKTTTEGTSDASLVRMLKKHGFIVKKTRFFKDIQDHLAAGGAVIMSHLINHKGKDIDLVNFMVLILSKKLSLFPKR
jgi:hypothetical protein